MLLSWIQHQFLPDRCLCMKLECRRWGRKHVPVAQAGNQGSKLWVWEEVREAKSSSLSPVLSQTPGSCGGCSSRSVCVRVSDSYVRLFWNLIFLKGSIDSLFLNFPNNFINTELYFEYPSYLHIQVMHFLPMCLTHIKGFRERIVERRWEKAIILRNLLSKYPASLQLYIHFDWLTVENLVSFERPYQLPKQSFAPQSLWLSIHKKGTEKGMVGI